MIIHVCSTHIMKVDRPNAIANVPPMNTAVSFSIRCIRCPKDSPSLLFQINRDKPTCKPLREAKSRKFQNSLWLF